MGETDITNLANEFFSKSADELRDNQEISKKELEQKTELLVNEALQIMEQKYGEPGKEPKPYHNPNHLKAVWTAAKKIANKMGLNREDQLLLKIAVFWHDLDSNQDSGVDEVKTAKSIMDRMMELNFAPLQIRKVVEAVLATRWYNDANGAIAQRVNNLLAKEVAAKFDYDLPVGATTFSSGLSPIETLSILKFKKIMADADIYHTGSDWNTYYANSILICREVGVLPNHPEPYTPEEWDHFYEVQINILEGFTKRVSGRTKDSDPTSFGYYTKEAQEVLPHAKGNLEKLKQLRAELKLS